MPATGSRLPALAAALLCALPAAAGQRVQEVLISFDGAHEVAQWQRSRALAAETGARFTYFLSCVYLLSPETKTAYRPPAGIEAGRSNVGFAASADEVADRLGEIWAAHGEGHEIASHGCGHFDGRDWSLSDWQAEFAQFSAILRDAWQINGLALEPPGWREFAEGGIAGFRAPYLSTGEALDMALARAGFAYDASGVSRGPAHPAAKGGVWRFALPTIPEGPAARRVIAMDYNLFVRHSGGIERVDAGGAFEERTYRAFMDAFEAQASGERVPLQIGLHFSLMNGGAYWRALERFAREVCPRTDVRCGTYGAMAARLSEETRTPPGG